MVTISIENGLVIVAQIHMTTRGSGYIGLLWETCLIESLRSFNDFIESRSNFRGRNTSTKDVLGRYGRPVEITIGILALNQDGTFQRNTSEKTYNYIVASAPTPEYTTRQDTAVTDGKRSTAE